MLENPKYFRETFLKCGFNGANITVPLKETAFENCDEIYGIANNIKAVNTIINKNGKLIGYNTDASGFYESIKEFKGKLDKVASSFVDKAKLKDNNISCVKMSLK